MVNPYTHASIFFIWRLSLKDNQHSSYLQLESMKYNSSGIDKGCVAGALAYQVSNPVQFYLSDQNAW